MKQGGVNNYIFTVLLRQITQVYLVCVQNWF